MRKALAPALLVLSLAALVSDARAGVVVQDRETGRIYCRSRRFLVPYESVDSGPSGVSAVRLYYTDDGGSTWTLYREQAEPAGSFEFVAPADGDYGFTVEAVDTAGNVERKDGPRDGAEPEVAVIVDTKAPRLQPVFPAGGTELAPGAHLRVRFRAADPNLAPKSAAVDVRHEDAREWTRLSGITRDDGEFFVAGDELFTGDYDVTISISDRAGNSAERSYTFTCTERPTPRRERRPPAGGEWVVPIGAPPRAKSLVFDIDYTVKDIGGRPPASVGLWYTTDSGATWQFYGLDPDVTPPFRFQAPKEGVYGFKLTATASSGVAEAPPKPGTKPDTRTIVDATYPTLMIDDPRGGESYAGGDVHFVRWTARDEHFSSLPISIYTCRDGREWKLLAAELPNTGAYGWNVPNIDYASYRVKIEAKDVVGNKTSVVSDTFYVISAPPETRIKGVCPAVEAVGVVEITGDETFRPAQEPQEPPAEPVEQPTPPPDGKSEAEVQKLIEKATASRLRGDYEAAEAALREAVRRDRHGVEARNDLGALLIQQGRHSSAVEFLKEARNLAPHDTDVLYNLAAAYYALGNYDSAVAALETLAGIDPTGEALWSLAKAHYAAGDMPGARAVWKRLAEKGDSGGNFARRAERALASVDEAGRE